MWHVLNVHFWGKNSGLKLAYFLSNSLLCYLVSLFYFAGVP